jgi:hypothetical protein
MRSKIAEYSDEAEEAVSDIRRATRRHFSEAFLRVGPTRCMVGRARHESLNNLTPSPTSTSAVVQPFRHGGAMSN